MDERRERLIDILRKRGLSDFKLNVYRKVCSIPWGETRSYKWVAEALDMPHGARAVGQALKKNPCPFAIPCHRVIRSDGSAVGFSGGKGIKKRLLRLENVGIINEAMTYGACKGSVSHMAEL